MSCFSSTLFALLVLVGISQAFQHPSMPSVQRRLVCVETNTALRMSNRNEAAPAGAFMRWAKASRSAGAGDNVVELLRPLGMVLNQDDKGNVYVEQLAPKGNAARTGKVRTTIY